MACDLHEQVCRPDTKEADQSVVQASLGNLGLPQTEQYVEQLLKQYDGNGDSQVDWAEFRAYVQSKEKKIRHAFHQIDTDNSGEISLDELVCKPAALVLCTGAVWMWTCCYTQLCCRSKLWAPPGLQ